MNAGKDKAPPGPPPFMMARQSDVAHLIRNGALVYTWLDLETTDKEWMHLEMTVASLTTTDISYNLLSDDLYEVRVPDRVGLSPEAMLITRYMAEDVRDPRKLSPQHAAAKIFEDVQAAPYKLWNRLGALRNGMDETLWRDYIDEREIEIAGKSGKTKPVLVRHLPLLDERGQVVRNVRVHAPSDTRQFLQMSYKSDGPAFDYEDETGRWTVRNLDKFNLGFRNTFFDNRALAARLFCAGFPLKEIYALNRKGLGNHAVDVFTAVLANHFFGHTGRQRLALGERRDAATNRDRISAKLDLIMDENTRLADADADIPEGVRVYGHTLHNIRKGHNAPDYDNAKSIGVHAWLRAADPASMAHIESLGNIDYFRRFMTIDNEDGVPTTHPLRFIVASADDDKIYRAVPVFVLGSDDAHGKFNRIWTMRADIDYRHHHVDGKLVLDMSEEELAALMRNQRGGLDALFHEIHLKRHRGVVDLKTGLDAGHCPGQTPDGLRYMRDVVIDYFDDYDRPFLPRVLNAFARQHAFTQPADNVAQPYAEEEIWTAMGEVKYACVTLENGQVVHLPPLIRDMAQNEFDRINQRIGDTLRALTRVQPLELNLTDSTARAYAELRAEQSRKLARYQEDRKDGKTLTLPPAYYDDAFLKKNSPLPVPVNDIYATLIEDKLHLMDKLPETTRAYEVQRLIVPQGQGKPRWQRIPFPELAAMPERHLTALKDEGRLRVVFEPNPNRPAYRFMLRYFMENGMADLLSPAHREFYAAETAFYSSGPPYIKNPLDHKTMSGPRQKLSIEKIRANEHPGLPYVRATRTGETGAHDMFARDDMAEAILASIEKDGRRIARTYPLTPSRKRLFGIDPTTDRVLRNIKYEIPRKHLIVKIPDAHTSMPASHAHMGHLCFAIPPVPKIDKARHIILEEATTGRRYLAADAVVHPLPPRSRGEFETFYQTIDAAYAQSGTEPIQQGHIISCAELAPLSRIKDPKHPALYIPQQKLLATRAPRLANLQRDEPLTGFIFRQYDIDLHQDRKIRLRGRDDKGMDTGWEATARVKTEPRLFTLRDFLRDLDSPACRQAMDHIAFVCGYGTTDHMKAAIREEFTRFDEPLDDTRNRLIFFEIAPVKKLSHWTPGQPRACFEQKPAPKKRRMKTNAPILTGKQKTLGPAP